MKHYNSFNDYCRETFRKKVYKLSLDAGLSCPNRDGALDTRGCIFCDHSGGGAFSSCASLSISEQLSQAKQKVAQKTKDHAYIAYFQPFSNTYGEISYLRKIYYEAIAPDDIVALSVATRPDCLPNDVIDLLSELNRIKPVTVELGLQSIHEKTARYIRRGYPLSVYNDAVKKLHKAKLNVVTHLILGLPYEDERMMLESVSFVSQVTDGIKLQLLHVLKDTDLEKDYREGKFETLSLEQYTDILCHAIGLLSPGVVVHRITGDGAKKDLIAPLWSRDKKRVLNYINRELDRRNVIQGSLITPKAETT